MIRSPSYGERLTHNSSSGTVTEAKKYLMSLVDSSLNFSSSNFESPGSTIKSNRSGLSGNILMPRTIAGVKLEVRVTNVPARANLNYLRLMEKEAAGHKPAMEGQ